jgi:SAM-dependent methyltransferase
MSNRRELILKGLDLTSSIGVEVGPLDKPLVSKSDGIVHYVDHCDTEALRKKWQTDPNVDKSVLQVDAVWGKSTLREALQSASGGTWSGADYLVASHVIEHVPDLVTWLREVREVLKSDGSLRLIVPDRRFTFDLLRRTTTLSEVADAFVRQRRVPSASRILDFCYGHVHVDCTQAWDGTLKMKDLKRGSDDLSALNLARDAEENGTYHDVHCWVFTPKSFIELMRQMAGAGLLEYACDWIVPTKRYTFEFFVAMRPENCREAVVKSWRAAQDLLVEPSLAQAST